MQTNTLQSIVASSFSIVLKKCLEAEVPYHLPVHEANQSLHPGSTQLISYDELYVNVPITVVRFNKR